MGIVVTLVTEMLAVVAVTVILKDLKNHGKNFQTFMKIFVLFSNTYVK